ncbi:MAG: glycosyltransferase [Paludibacter sp.]|nr:glycosyltransferase [Paludibacter sp.]
MKNLKLKNNAGLNKSVGRKLMFPPVLLSNQTTSESWFENRKMQNNIELPEILVISSFPPRECGIATYSEDLITALNKKFGSSFHIKICALESGKASYTYKPEVIYVLDTSVAENFAETAGKINQNDKIDMVLIQHEFGFFQKQKKAFIDFLHQLTKPVTIVFHTVLPHPDMALKDEVQNIVNACGAIIVMTHYAETVLTNHYDIPNSKIAVIAHGTHLVPHLSKDFLKEKYKLTGKKVLTTFGLLSSGKSIETTLKALPGIAAEIPEVMFLIIGKTHPEVVKNEGEKYREQLKQMVVDLGIEKHVRFINSYLALDELLEYLQLTDIYLFTSNDPNQAVSGTFVYAMSCSCPIISTPIPHAKEVLTKETGILIDFQNSKQLSEAVLRLFNDEPLLKEFSNNTLQKIVFTAWENSAVAHAKLMVSQMGRKLKISYTLPEIKLDHLVKMTTDFGMFQFCKINQPDVSSGFTIDDNARALMTVAMHYELTKDKNDLRLMGIYLNFIKFCLQPGGNFLNYVDIDKNFTAQNHDVNLDDANGRTVWALGFLISKKAILPDELIATATSIFEKTLPHIETIHSTRALAFVIKGLYFYNKVSISTENVLLSERLADRLVNMYQFESAKNWEWFESYLTYANSILSEAMLCAYLITGKVSYKLIAVESFDFLLSHIFNKNGIEVISNKRKFTKGEIAPKFGEQPIDVAYTILTLSKFYDEFDDKKYLHQLTTAFNWFLGENRLNQIIYNPCTGGCYDGLEEHNINLNQGAESTVSYLMARMTVEKYVDLKQ